MVAVARYELKNGLSKTRYILQNHTGLNVEGFCSVYKDTKQNLNKGIANKQYIEFRKPCERGNYAKNASPFAMLVCNNKGVIGGIKNNVYGVTDIKPLRNDLFMSVRVVLNTDSTTTLIICFYRFEDMEIGETIEDVLINNELSEVVESIAV